MGVRESSVLHGPSPLFDALDVSAARHPQKPCTWFEGKTLTYQEIKDRSDYCAAGLQSLGVKKGVRVALLMPNIPQFVMGYYAILKAGGVVVNLSPLGAVDELVHVLADSESSFVITCDAKILYERLQAALPQLASRPRLIMCSVRDDLPRWKSLYVRCTRGSDFVSPPSGVPLFSEFMARGARPSHVDIDPLGDLAVLQYTGGTTGFPKGAMLSHANLISNAQQCLVLFEAYDIDKNDKFVTVLPLFHCFAMTACMNTGLLCGSELVLVPRFVPGALLKTIQTTQATVLVAVPTLLLALAVCPEVKAYDVSSLRFAISGGAPLKGEVQKRFEAATGCTVREGYGLSEASPVVACNPGQGLNKIGTVGLPLKDTDVVIAGEDGPSSVFVDQKKVGEIWVKGPQVMLGYWKREEENALALKNGYLRTGDLGYLDEDGYLTVVDRSKDLIIYNGYNVYPRRVEEVILKHPSVQDAAVIGMHDPFHGEIPKAYVELVSGASLSKESLEAFLKPKLSSVERPKFYEFVSELPKTVVGKVSKRALREGKHE